MCGCSLMFLFVKTSWRFAKIPIFYKNIMRVFGTRLFILRKL